MDLPTSGNAIEGELGKQDGHSRTIIPQAFRTWLRFICYYRATTTPINKYGSDVKESCSDQALNGFRLYLSSRRGN